MKKFNIISAIVFAALGAATIIASQKMGGAVTGTAMGSGVWPTLLGAIMVILSAVLLVQSLLEKAPAGEEEQSPIDFTSPGMIRIYKQVALMTVFAVLLKLFGFYIAMLFLIPATLILLGERKPWKIAAITIGALVFVYLVFVVMLNLKLPVGSVLRL